MKQHYYIHIGNGKTGTTSIQDFLKRNRSELKTNAIFYPKERGDNYGHHFLIQDGQDQKLSAAQQSKSWKRLLSEAKASQCKKVVISSERLATLAREEEIALIRDMLRDEDVTIIYYVRRHDAYMESVYNYSLRSGATLLTPDEYIKKNNRDFLTILNRWADVFGDENIIVFPFEKENLTPSLVHTFLDCINEKMRDEYHAPKHKNKSPHADIIASAVMVAEVAKLGIFDEEDLHYVISSFQNGPCQLVSPVEKYNIFSPAQQKTAIDMNADSYQKIAKRFLGRQDGLLFSAPLPKENDKKKEKQPLTTDSLLMMMISMQVMNIRRLNRLQRKTPQYILKNFFKKIMKTIGL